ncbi:MAG: adenosylcobinamide-phosphate synthase CbiB [Bryobacteraceae bacterium]
MMVTPFALACGVAADLALGDPRWMPHPIVGVGNLAAWMERVWRRTSLPLRVAGIGAWCGVLGVSCGVVFASVRLLPEPFVQIYWIYSLLAVRSLDDHAMAVVRPLRDGDLATAREAAARIVGRDTDALDACGVTRAMVETVAENLNDGVVAPLFWLTLGGPVAMAAYKAVNTMDSMFGHKNERYLQFGWCAARMDDLANLIPARLTAGLIWLIAAIWPGMSFSGSIRSTWRDAHRQPSPNSGYPEAAAAGALGVQLGGVNFYCGVRSEKALLGEDLKPLDWRVYGGMRVLLYGSALLFVGVILWL